jgi:hypothetical protein
MTSECCRRQLIRQPVVPGAWVGGALFLGEGVHDGEVHVGKAVADGWKAPSTRQCGEDETFFRSVKFVGLLVPHLSFIA